MRVLASEGNLMSLIEILSTGKTAGQLLIPRYLLAPPRCWAILYLRQPIYLSGRHRPYRCLHIGLFVPFCEVTHRVRAKHQGGRETQPLLRSDLP